MQAVSSGIRDATLGSVRSPSAVVELAWQRQSQTLNWFRLDESALDSGFILSLETYLEGQDPSEIITELDKYYFTEETNNLISAEGYEELSGDLDQSVIADLDIVLFNENERYTIDNNKNLLLNPSFEFGFNDWNIGTGAGFQALNVSGASDVRSGVSAAQLSNQTPSVDGFIYSNDMQVTSGIDHTLSFYARGVGNLLLTIFSIGSGGSVVNSGVSSFPLSSGSFNRYVKTFSISSFADSARVRVGVPSGVALIDDGMFEEGSAQTDYEHDFIGNYILPKRPIKVGIKMLTEPSVGSGGIVPRFAGLTETLDPDLSEDTISIRALDFASEMMSREVTDMNSGMGMYQNMNSKILIRELGFRAGLSESDMILEEGKQDIPFAWFREGSVWFYMKNIAEAEGGRVFFDEEGILRFWNRNHIDVDAVASGAVASLSMNEWVKSMRFRVEANRLKNHVIVKSNPRVVQANQPVWSLEATVEMAVGENLVVWANINDEEGRDMPCTTLDEPEKDGSTSYFKANDSSDGTGEDRTNSVNLVSFDAFGTAAKMIFDNQYGSNVFLTKVVIYGRPAKIVKEISVEKEDEGSISLYGRETLQIENDFITSEDFANNIASDKLFNKKNPTDLVDLETIGIPYLQLGDLLSVQTKYPPNEKYKSLFVRQNRWQILPDGEFVQNLQLESRTIAEYLTLDEDTLDGPAVLAI